MLTVLGEALIDLVADAADPGDTDTGETDTGRSHAGRFTARPGGSPLNVAVGLARLGHDTQMMARLADDAFGRILRAHARDNGVGLEVAPAATEHTTLAVVSLDAQGRAAYDFYIEGTADWQWSEAELAAFPADTQVFHTGSNASWTPPGDERIAELTRQLHGRGGVLLTYDPNVRPKVLREPARARRLVERSVGNAHLVKVSDEDMEFLYPDDDPLDAARRWLDLGPALVMLTRGGNGATAITIQGQQATRTPPQIKVADTIGAGDSFTSGLISSLVDRSVTTPDGLAGADEALLHELLGDAMLTAALTCQRHGAEPPTRAEAAAERERLARTGQ